MSNESYYYINRFSTIKKIGCFYIRLRKKIITSSFLITLFNLAKAEYILNFISSQSSKYFQKVKLLIKFISNHIMISSISKKRIWILVLILKIKNCN